MDMAVERCVAAGTNRYARGSSRSSGGTTPMWKLVLEEAREVVWLAALVSGLSAVGIGIVVTLVAV
jgi:hypothetical protein